MKNIRIDIRLCSILLLLALVFSVFSFPALASGESQAAPTTEETEVPWANDPSEYRENLLAGAADYEAGCDTALLLELNSGIVVYAKNAEERVFPASLTKIMTCLVALKFGGTMLDSLQVTVSQTALDGIADAGGEVRLKLGEQMSLRNALYYMMVVSSNESANVVAEAIGGDIPTFVNMMNETAKELGCTGTHFTNAHGLHDPSHYTTARDLSIITRAALTYETFREIVATAEYTVPATNMSNPSHLVTTNYLILGDGNRYLADNGAYYTYYYNLANGIKTGYTSAAGRCVVSRATDGNLDLLCVIMGAKTRMMEDGSTRYENFVEAKKLFNYGFDNFAYAKLASSGDNPDPVIQVPVKFSDDKRGVVLVPGQDVNCLLPKEYDRDKVTYSYSLDAGKELQAPLAREQKVGTITMYYDGDKAGEADLITLTAVQEKKTERVISDVTGADKPNSEKAWYQVVLYYIIHYWYVPVLILVGGFLILILWNVSYRAYRRRQIRQRREREAARKRRMAQYRERNGK